MERPIVEFDRVWCLYATDTDIVSLYQFSFVTLNRLGRIDRVNLD
ncbi:MAG: hypothetical protein CLLPBCKN_002400 [Chroococcidiopsis cubana SAG 39.79]|nr:hypothetical protein [Chroococcidiopsis cubana]MDZ4873004.1 hypothetical protein [Chroococcidiopsis cubana SAG 39.79]